MLSFNQIMPKTSRKLSPHHSQARLASRCLGMLRFVEDKPLTKWQAQLARTQAELAQLGPMRPGSLSQQFKDPAAKTRAYWQLSYTHNMRSRTRYVRPEEVTSSSRSSLTSNASANWSIAASIFPFKSPTARRNCGARTRPNRGRRPP